MPLYEYLCADCNRTVEVLIRSAEEKPECPDCGGKKLRKQLSVAAAPSVSSAEAPTCGKPQCQSGCMFD